MTTRFYAALVTLLLSITPLVLLAQCEDNFFLGADFSSLNQVEDAGAVFRLDGQSIDPLQLFADKGCQISRVRLWHNPNWLNACGQMNSYGNLEEVIAIFTRAKAQGMDLMLDIQYSDRSVDVDYQRLPEAWLGISNLDVLKDSVYNYTYAVLMQLGELDLFPKYVQIGHEINNGFCDETDTTTGFNWARSGALLNEASRATRNAGYHLSKNIKIVLHIDEPENVDGWMEQALQNEVTNFDIIGFSYFPQWSSQSIAETGAIIRKLKYKFRRDVMVLETGFPWTNNWADDLDNMLDNASAQHDFFSISPTGQQQFLQTLTQTVVANGGIGVLYWEPIWISTDACNDLGQGSPYENATLFNFFMNNEATAGIDFFNYAYDYPVEVTFKVNMNEVNIDKGVFLNSSFTGDTWQFQPMEYEGNYTFTYKTCLMPGENHDYAFYNGQFWDPQEKETIPDGCATGQGNLRNFQVGADALTLAYNFASCSFTSAPCSSLPSVWNAADIGIVSSAGNACYDPAEEKFTIGGFGMRMGQERDDYHFVWQEVSGDVGITARVDELTNTNGKAFAGLMIRSSQEWDATYAMALFEPWGATALQARFQEGSNFSIWTGIQIPPEVKWMHLHRYENKFIAFHSEDGQHWTPTDSIIFNMPDTVMIGMAVHSHVFGRTNVSEFSNVEVSNDSLRLSPITSQHEAGLSGINSRLFPNPAQNYFQLEVPTTGLQGRLYDVHGRLLKQFDINDDIYRISCLDLPSGVYFIKLSDGIREETHRLLKE